MTIFDPSEVECEKQEMACYGHGRDLVVTHPEPGKFVERPMTAAELAAREPATVISDNIWNMAIHAGLAYIMAWEVIVPAIEKAVAGEREARENLESALRRKDAVMQVLLNRLTAAGVDFSDLIP